MASAASFSPTYRRARERFLEAAERVGARIESRVLPGHRGLGGEELAMDWARLGPVQASRMLAVSSGMHGVEGFIGSALQLELLEGWNGRGLGRAGTGLLLVHGVNPHGFSHVDRSNEQNVDLNRNFLSHPDGHHPNADYIALASEIAPASLGDDADTRRLARLHAFVERHGERRFEAALSGGQHSHPEGLFYGGRESQWSSRCLLEGARHHGEGLERVAWIDVHTGLGERADLAILSDLPEDDPGARRAARWHGTDFESIAGGEGLSVVTHGSVDVALLDALAGAGEATMVTAEFGTVPAFQTFLALRSRNWLRHHGDLDPRDPAARAIREELRAAFDPRDDRWRTRVLEGAHRAIAATLTALDEPRSG